MTSVDVGLRAIAGIHERLLIDEKWTHRTPRAFSWIGHRLVQTVWVSPIVDDDGLSLTLVSARVRLIDNIAVAPARVEAILGASNSLAVGSAYLYNPEERCVELCLAYTVHEETLRDRVDDFATYMILQLCEAEENADGLASALLGQVAVRTHGESGIRESRDEMLNVVRDVYAPAGQGISSFINLEEMMTVAEMCEGTPHAAMRGDEMAACIEVAFGLNATTLIELRADITHPWLGAGLAVRTTIPPAIAEEELGRSTNLLQTMQLSTMDGGGQVGAWYVGRHRESPYVTWTRFVPNLLFRHGYARNVAMSEIVRAVWVDRLFHPDLPPRSAWPIMQARYEAQQNRSSE